MAVHSRTLGRVLTASVVVGVAALFAAPAGALTDPAEWGDTFCTETGVWLAGAQAGADELEAQAENPSLTPADAKASIVDYLSTGVGATKSFAQAVKRAGAPDVQNGVKIQAAILAGIAGSAAKLAALEKAAKAIPTKPAAAFRKATAKLGPQLSKFAQPFQKGLGKAESLDSTGELDAVLGTLPSCDELDRFVSGI